MKKDQTSLFYALITPTPHDATLREPTDIKG